MLAHVVPLVGRHEQASSHGETAIFQHFETAPAGTREFEGALVFLMGLNMFTWLHASHTLTFPVAGGALFAHDGVFAGSEGCYCSRL